MAAHNTTGYVIRFALPLARAVRRLPKSQMRRYEVTNIIHACDECIIVVSTLQPEVCTQRRDSQGNVNQPNQRNKTTQTNREELNC